MGQKTNSNVLRIGDTKQWKSKYIEKKSSEFATYVFYDLETRKFIQKLLSDNNLTLHNCQTRYLENSLHIYVSYYITTEAFLSIKNRTKKNHIKTKLKEKFFTKKFQRKYFNLKQKTNNYFKYHKTIYKIKNDLLTKKYTKKNLHRKNNFLVKRNNYLLKYKRNKFIYYHKLTTLNSKLKTIEHIETSSFWNKIAESIHLFLNGSTNITLQLRQLTKPTIRKFTKKQLKVLKKAIGQLRKYKQSKFFIKGINIIFTFIIYNQSSNFLATFIASELKKQKRHNFFLSFVKTAIKLFNQKKITNPRGIKIKIKGRFNGAPRAKHRIINIGNGVPVLSLKSNIDYSETTAFTANGTFGVKIWTFTSTPISK